MKKILFFICFFISVQIVAAQSKNTFFEATYSFKPQTSTEENVKNEVLKLLIFSNLKYIVKANAFIYSLMSSEVGVNSENIQTKISGPTKIYFDIKNKNILFDEDGSLSIFNFKTVDFKKLNYDTLVTGYKCKLLTTKNDDSLFVSPKLPFYINPFLLSNNEIHFGVAKAIIHNSGVYTLETLNKQKGLPFFKVRIFN